MRTPNDRVADGVIEALALSEAELLERVASLEADLGIYRELVQTSLTALRDKTLECDQYKRRIDTMVSEVRALRQDLRTMGAQLRAVQHPDEVTT